MSVAETSGDERDPIAAVEAALASESFRARMDGELRHRGWPREPVLVSGLCLALLREMGVDRSRVAIRVRWDPSSRRLAVAVRSRSQKLGSRQKGERINP